MRACIFAMTLIGPLCAAPPVSAAPDPVSAQVDRPPFVDHISWVQWRSGSQLSSLRVYPTASGRAAAKQLGSSSPEAGEAWAEVVALAPQADTAGMRDQFRCHWDFAENVQPGKTSWNLEPWRPVVDDATMVTTGCNPGGPQEPF
ncbi:DUF2599 domain-containing protein [Mycobacterium paraterrae]|uniref:DUF2599 domain-containing protein n=1 Tax=Mycobacterium paraterrae TaxID=577492 RepID=A0ABY3VN65_9MYCO|nr:DUF2599 domain-containing protein [Mycobacterium paraterrae]UMB68918.1 DUF2599 domain-containing protein [Mycobacterium paraterrae]